ncbi:PucR family transcriptional regulator [Microbacterium rhizomatis]|uniref:PucR family transcriptional regulator n=1 Tax=Microbacterium rhizomatis TaxID=1631477 RepID=A0A5J5J2Q1_9MICO|nr:PucR family transcriptional regulator [Microbacterium rhizomatis]KAA9107683.1 PucR family transcriptional regulator [Microbacterium rhizomatis]
MDASDDAPTLRALLRRRDLALRLEGEPKDLAPGALDRPVRWVHSSDLADPTPFLSEGLALLTTGTQFLGVSDTNHADDSAVEAYVRRLHARGVVALGFGTEVVREGIPQALIASCRAIGMPLFEVPYRTPFIAVARANAEAVAAQAYARRSWALAAQRAIALAALRPDGLGATLAELARQLDTWVGLFDASGVLTREHPAHGLDPAVRDELQAEVGAVLRRGARAGSALHIGDTPFSLQTLGRGGHLRGVIAIAAGELDQEGRGVVTAVIAMAGLAFEQNQGLSRARGMLRAGLVQSLLADDSTLARRISRDLWGPLPTAPVTIAVTEVVASRVDAIAELLELRADERRGALFFGRGTFENAGEGFVVVVPSTDESVLVELAERFELALGLSAPAGYDGFAEGVRQAQVALRSSTGAGLRRYGDVARGGVLAALATDEARVLARSALAPLREHDAAHGTALIDTLRAWLDADGSHEASARALGVHRHTVRARIGLAERVLGRDLGTFAARAELWAALRALGDG